MLIEGVARHGSSIHAHFIEMKTICPKIGGNGESESVEFLPGVIGVLNGFGDVHAMKVVIDNRVERVLGMFWNRWRLCRWNER